MQLRHPAFSEIVREVDNPDEWKCAGWVPVESKPTQKKASPKRTKKN